MLRPTTMLDEPPFFVISSWEIPSSRARISMVRGEQINRFAKSLVAAAHGEETPIDGYKGAYIDEIGRASCRERV